MYKISAKELYLYDMELTVFSDESFMREALKEAQDIHIKPRVE